MQTICKCLSWLLLLDLWKKQCHWLIHTTFARVFTIDDQFWLNKLFLQRNMAKCSLVASTILFGMFLKGWMEVLLTFSWRWICYCALYRDQTTLHGFYSVLLALVFGNVFWKSCREVHWLSIMYVLIRRLLCQKKKAYDSHGNVPENGIACNQLVRFYATLLPRSSWLPPPILSPKEPAK